MSDLENKEQAVEQPKKRPYNLREKKEKDAEQEYDDKEGGES